MSQLTEPWVYAWPQSVAAGESVAIHAAGPRADVEIEIARIGAEREVVLTTSARIEPAEIADDASSKGVEWPTVCSLAVPASWRSGYYEISLRTRVGSWHEALAFFVVRAATADPQRPLLVLATNTYAAYNDFGGPNLYSGGFIHPKGGTRVSFVRPLARGFLRKPPGPGSRVAVTGAPDPVMRAHVEYVLGHQFSEWVGSAGWPNWELPFVRWAENAGYALDYAANADLELVPNLLDGRRLYLSVGHDEYWSWEMRDAVERFTAAGGNAVFLSGNTSYWQVRMEDGGRAMTCYKQRFTEDPLHGTERGERTTSIWSDRATGRPENRMTGVSFVRGGYSRIGGNVPRAAGGYTVARPEHWVFEGTGLRYGDLLGADAVVVGYECDGCDLTLRDGLPYATGLDGTPDDFTVLALAPAEPFDHANALRPVPSGELSEIEFNAERVLGAHDRETVAKLKHGHAVMGIHEPGGTVFTSGCTDWVHGLAAGDPTIERITRNLLDRLTR
jgi:hypothetical protein